MRSTPSIVCRVLPVAIALLALQARGADAPKASDLDMIPAESGVVFEAPCLAGFMEGIERDTRLGQMLKAKGGATEAVTKFFTLVQGPNASGGAETPDFEAKLKAYGLSQADIKTLLHAPCGMALLLLPAPEVWGKQASPMFWFHCGAGQAKKTMDGMLAGFTSDGMESSEHKVGDDVVHSIVLSDRAWGQGSGSLSMLHVFVHGECLCFVTSDGYYRSEEDKTAKMTADPAVQQSLAAAKSGKSFAALVRQSSGLESALGDGLTEIGLRMYVNMPALFEEMFTDFRRSDVMHSQEGEGVTAEADSNASDDEAAQKAAREHRAERMTKMRAKALEFAKKDLKTWGLDGVGVMGYCVGRDKVGLRINAYMPTGDRDHGFLRVLNQLKPFPAQLPAWADGDSTIGSARVSLDAKQVYGRVLESLREMHADTEEHKQGIEDDIAAFEQEFTDNAGLAFPDFLGAFGTRHEVAWLTLPDAEEVKSPDDMFRFAYWLPEGNAVFARTFFDTIMGKDDFMQPGAEGEWTGMSHAKQRRRDQTVYALAHDKQGVIAGVGAGVAEWQVARIAEAKPAPGFVSLPSRPVLACGHYRLSGLLDFLRKAMEQQGGEEGARVLEALPTHEELRESLGQAEFQVWVDAKGLRMQGALAMPPAKK